MYRRWGAPAKRVVEVAPRLPVGPRTGRVGWHEGQLELRASQARFKIPAMGRRWGKTMWGVGWMVDGMVKYPGDQFWWVAPNYPLTQRGMRWWKRMIPPGAYKEYKAQRYMEFPNGAQLWFKSADSDSLVGEGVRRLLLDEAARIPVEKWEVDLRATLADMKGEGVFISTPKGMNWFHKLWVRGNDPNELEWESFNCPTSDNPEIDPEELEEIRRTVPEHVWRQEFLAQFLEDSAGVFRGVDRCVDENLRIQKQPKGLDRFYVMGVDLGKYQDFTVITILDDKGILVGWDRFKDVDWGFQKSRIVMWAKAFNAAVALDSSGLGDPIFDELVAEGLNVEGYKFTNESKRILVEGLSLAIEQEKLRYPNIPELIGELKIFEYEFIVTAGRMTGRIRYGAPPGQHDDCVISLGLANWKLNRPRKEGWILF